MPFFGPSGKELNREETKSWHVYSPAKELLTRAQLQASVVKGGYKCQVVDPSDYRPLPDGRLEGEGVLISSRSRAIESLPRQRTRKKLLAAHDIALIDLVVECPFEATQVLGPANGLEATFGADGAKILRHARTLYAVNVPSQASPLATRMAHEMSQIIAREVAGAVYDCESRCFVTLA